MNMLDYVLNSLETGGRFDGLSDAELNLCGLAMIADAITEGFRHIGSGDACTEGWGAMEALGKHTSDALKEIARCISDSISELATAIEEKQS